MHIRLPDWRRVARVVSVCVAALLAVHVAAQAALAAAVARSPNSWGVTARSGAPPAELAGRDVRALRTLVGRPEATLASWVLEPAAQQARGTVLLMHGVRMGKESLARVGVALSDAGYRAVLLDLRGHGESSGRYLTYGEVEARDAAAVLDDVGSRSGPLGCVGAYGFSYGASVALELGALDPRVKAVVAVSAFSSLRGVVGDYREKYLPGPLRLLPDAWFDGVIAEAGRIASFDPDASAPLVAVGRSRASMLMIHGTADSQVPERHSRALVGAAEGRAALVSVPGAGHGDMPADATGLVRRETLAWFDRFLAGPSCGS